MTSGEKNVSKICVITRWSKLNISHMSAGKNPNKILQLDVHFYDKALLNSHIIMSKIPILNFKIKPPPL